MRNAFFVFCLLFVATTECMFQAGHGSDEYRRVCDSFLKGDYVTVATEGKAFRDNSGNEIKYRKVLNFLLDKCGKLINGGVIAENLGENDDYVKQSASSIIGQRCASLLTSGGKSLIPENDLKEAKMLLDIEREFAPDSEMRSQNLRMLQQKEALPALLLEISAPVSSVSSSVSNSVVSSLSVSNSVGSSSGAEAAIYNSVGNSWETAAAAFAAALAATQ